MTTPTPSDSLNHRFYVWHDQGDCAVVGTIEEARELRDDYMDDGIFSTITNEENEGVS